MKIWLDTESVGLVGRVKTVQYIVEDGPVEMLYLPEGWWSRSEKNHHVVWLYERVWRNKDCTLYAYNAAHDVFKMAQLFHEWMGLRDYRSERPVPPPLCKVVDLYIHAALKSPLAPYMNRGGRHMASIKRLPLDVGPEMASRVEENLEELIPKILTLKRSEHEVKDRPDLITYSWRVEQGMRLKTLMQYYGLPVLDISELWPLPKHDGYKEIQPHPYEVDWHKKASRECDRIMADPAQAFHRYAALDPVYTKLLWAKLDQPLEPTDNDMLTAMVGYTRYHGFTVDKDLLARTCTYYQDRIMEAERAFKGIDLKSPKQRLELLQRYEPLIQSTGRPVLEHLRTHENEALRTISSAMLSYGMMKQRLNQCEGVRTCLTGHMHLDFRVLGTATNRMAGSSGLNGQGISRTPDDGYWLRGCILTQAGGDFDALEMTLMPSVYGCEQLQADLDNGVDLHMMTACLTSPWWPPELSYETAVKLTKKNPLYAIVREARQEHGKRLNFALAYGCQAMKVSEILGCNLEEAQRALDRFFTRYKGIRRFRECNEREFQTADTDYWTRSSVSEMKDYSESLFGFRRYYAFEKQIAELFWEMGHSRLNLGSSGYVVRQEHKGQQTYAQAVRSACLGAAIAIQQAVARQAGNQPIQTSGSELTKELCRLLWDEFHYPMMNIHDEVQIARSPHAKFDQAAVDRVVQEFLERRREQIPSLNINVEKTERWSDK